MGITPQERSAIAIHVQRALQQLDSIGGGIVAKTRECAIVGTSDEIAASDRQPKQLFDKLQLREWVTFAHPFGSPLPNHVDPYGQKTRCLNPIMIAV